MIFEQVELEAQGVGGPFDCPGIPRDYRPGTRTVRLRLLARNFVPRIKKPKSRG
jgi:hypothetical protein